MVNVVAACVFPERFDSADTRRRAYERRPYSRKACSASCTGTRNIFVALDPLTTPHA